MTPPVPRPDSPPSRWRIRRWWAGFPRWGRVAALFTLVTGVAAVGYYLTVTRARANYRQQVAARWSAFEKAARAADDAGMRAALDDLLALQPDDPLVRRRKRAMEEGDSDPHDAAMCAVTVLRQVRDGKWSDAEREADKRLAHDPNDWICRCVKVAAALARNDRAAAEARLNELPDPSDSTVAVSPDGALFAAQLFRATDRDPAPVRTFLRAVIVPRLRALAADNDPPAVTEKLLRCYLEAFHPTDTNPAGLALAVAHIDRLIETATKGAAAANDVPTLVRLGQVCERLFAAFDTLHRDKAMTAVQHKAVRAEHHARTRAVWQAVRDRAATEPQAYRGLALAHLRDGDATKATETVLEGLTVAAADPALLALLTLLRQQDSRAAEALAAAGQAADRDPSNVPLQLVAAEAAAAAGRNDLVLVACRRVYEKQPKNAVAARLEARAYLLAGDPHKAVQILAEKVGEDRLAEDPVAVRWYVRARLDSLPVGLDSFLRKCERVAYGRQDPALLAAALAGVADARFLPEWTATAVRMASQWLDRRPNDTAMMRVRAVLLARAAERIAPAWSPTNLRPAVDAYSVLRLTLDNDLDVAAELAWLRLKGERDVPQAVRAAAPLAGAAAKRDALTARQLEVLGAVCLADGQFDLAVRALESAVRVPVPTPTARIHLALAYWKRGRENDARAVLEDARRYRTGPWPEQDEADYRLAVETFQRVNR